MRKFEKASVQNIETISCPKVVRFQICSASDECTSGFG